MKKTSIRGHSTTHRETLNRLARVEGQIRGVSRLVEEGAYCVDILTQIQAAQSALRAISRRILTRHIETCVMGAARKGDEREMRKKLDEVESVLRRCG